VDRHGQERRKLLLLLLLLPLLLLPTSDEKGTAVSKGRQSGVELLRGHGLVQTSNKHRRRLALALRQTLTTCVIGEGLHFDESPTQR
jgi:hypothetical protein